MEVTVRVMCRGIEIDRITRPLRTEGNQSAVTYRKLLWPVADGCIDIGREDDAVDLAREPSMEDWGTLVTSLLRAPLPTEPNACSELIDRLFLGKLPSGVICAVSSLTCLRREEEARNLLVDFLHERKDSANLYRLLRIELRSGRRASEDHDADIAQATLPSLRDISLSLIPDDGDDSSWGWESLAEVELPVTDDLHLREVAKYAQEALGSYRPVEDGTWAAELAEPLEDSGFSDEVASAKPSINSSADNVLLERTYKLGEKALDILRYFMDNPGDRSNHAQLVLGYPVSDINKLLSGSLSPYLKRNSVGGWDCYPWVPSLLAEMDKAS
jgi:hypothetical protein